MIASIASTARALWLRINEPRSVSVMYFLAYLVLLCMGAYALVNPPTSIEGPIGTFAMNMLAGTLTFGASVGVVSVLPGIWWLERTAVLSISLSSTLYLIIIIALHTQGTGNRLLQAGFVCFVLIMQGVRWVRVAKRPYDPDRVNRAPEPAA